MVRPKKFDALAPIMLVSILLVGAAVADAPPLTRDVQFGQTIYHLPVAAYRIWVQPYDKTRDHAAFGFDAIAPTVAPATSDLKEAATWGNGSGWHRDIHILVEYGRSFITQQQQIDNAYSESEEMKKLEHGPGQTAHFRYLDRNVFVVLPNGCKVFEGYSIRGNEMQTCTDKGEPLAIFCRPEKEVLLPGAKVWKLSPSCTVMENLDDKTTITYSFSYDYSESALQLHRDLLTLLRSFQRS